MKLWVIWAAIFLALCSLETNAQQLDASSTIKALQAANPKVKWDTTRSSVADVTCDGKLDTVTVGYLDQTVWLGVVPSARANTPSKAIIAKFAVGAHDRASFCAVPVRVLVYPIRCQNEAGALRGCKSVKGCAGFSLTDDECDAFHFYWDSSRKTLKWRRR
jgi:hypothetical protein